MRSSKARVSAGDRGVTVERSLRTGNVPVPGIWRRVSIGFAPGSAGFRVGVAVPAGFGEPGAGSGGFFAPSGCGGRGSDCSGEGSFARGGSGFCIRA